MFNHKLDKNGVFIGNLANYGEHYGITQYCFAHCYDLAGKSFDLCDGSKERNLTFKCKKNAAIDGVPCQYEALKLTPTCYLVRLGFNAAVVDLRQGCITLIEGKDYYFGKIKGFDAPEGAAHVDGGDDLVETNVAWYLGVDRYVHHEYLDKDIVRVRWTPHPESIMDSPYRVTKIDYPVYLVDVEDYGPYFSDAPKLLERTLFLQDYDHMMTVGIIWAGGEIPMMVSGFAKYMDVDEDNTMDEIAGGS